MKRILSTLVLLTMVLAATADDELWVAGTKLDLNKTYSQESLNGDLGGGYFYYSPSAKKLTLVGVTIKRSGDGKNGIDCKVADLKVVFQGINSIQTSAACIKLQANTTIENEGYVTLNCTGSNEGIYIMNTSIVTIQGGTWNITGDTGIEGKNGNQTVQIMDSKYSPLFLTVNGKNGCVLDLSQLFLIDLDVCDPIRDKLNQDYINSSSSSSSSGAVIHIVEFRNAIYGAGTTTPIKNQDVVIGTPAFKLSGHGFATAQTKIEASTITGTVTYNHSTKTITMNNAVVSDCFEPFLDGLTLKLIGQNYMMYEKGNYCIRCTKNLTIQGSGTLNTGPILLKGEDDIFYMDITGNAKVKITNDKDYYYGITSAINNMGMVRITNSTLNINVNSISPCSNAGLILNGSVINSPSIIRLTNDGQGHLMSVKNEGVFACYDIDRQTLHQGTLDIVPGTSYELWVNGVQVNSKNYSSLSSALNGGGSCSYNPNTKTLTLNKAKISYEDSYYNLFPAIYNKINGLVINNSGTSEVGGNFCGIESEADFTIKGSGHLKVTGTGIRFGAIRLKACDLTVDNTELTGTGGKYAIFADPIDYTNAKGCVILKDSYLHLSGTTQAVDVLLFDPNCVVTKPVNGKIMVGYITESNGTTKAKEVEIEPKKGISTTIDTVAPIEESSETSIYTTSGTLVWKGKGQPQLPQGIYLIKKNGKVQKVQKN